ncbi:hypothetical protein HDU98_010666, partial [Podochytrium sp. JEL0797]
MTSEKQESAMRESKLLQENQDLVDTQIELQNKLVQLESTFTEGGKEILNLKSALALKVEEMNALSQEKLAWKERESELVQEIQSVGENPLGSTSVLLRKSGQTRGSTASDRGSLYVPGTEVDIKKLEQKLIKTKEANSELKEKHTRSTQECEVLRLECFNLKDSLNQCQQLLKMRADEIKILVSETAFDYASGMNSPDRVAAAKEKYLALTESLEASRLECYNLNEKISALEANRTSNEEYIKCKGELLDSKSKHKQCQIELRDCKSKLASAISDLASLSELRKQDLGIKKESSELKESQLVVAKLREELSQSDKTLALLTNSLAETKSMLETRELQLSRYVSERQTILCENSPLPTLMKTQSILETDLRSPFQNEEEIEGLTQNEKLEERIIKLFTVAERLKGNYIEAQQLLESSQIENFGLKENLSRAKQLLKVRTSEFRALIDQTAKKLGDRKEDQTHARDKFTRLLEQLENARLENYNLSERFSEQIMLNAILQQELALEMKTTSRRAADEDESKRKVLFQKLPALPEKAPDFLDPIVPFKFKERRTTMIFAAIKLDKMASAVRANK